MLDDFEKEKLKLNIAANIGRAYFIITRPFSLIIIVALLLTWPVYAGARAISQRVFSIRENAYVVSAHPAAINPVPVSIIKSQFLPIAGDSYAAFAIVKNLNGSLAAPNISYTFRFLDGNGKELGNYSNNGFLLPGEQKYIIAPSIRLHQPPQKVSVEITNQIWKKKLSLPDIQVISDLPVSGDQNEPLGYYVDGNIVNKSVFSIGTVRVNVVLLDKSGNEIAVNQTTVNSLLPSEKRGYHLFWPVPLAAAVANVRVFPEANILDSANIAIDTNN